MKIANLKPSIDCQRVRKARARGLAAALLMCALTGPALQAQTYTLSNAWTIANGVGHLDSSTANTANRSIAYSTVSNQVFVANKTVPAIDAFDGSTGNYLGSLNVTVANSGNFHIGQVAVADDGAIYGANLVSPTVATATPFRLYRWANWQDSAPATSYSGDPTGGNSTAGKRMGDNIAIKGSGTNTVILAPLYTSSPAATTNMALFSTTDGTNFNAIYLLITNLPPLTPNGATHGFAFYTNNTFWFKPPGASAYLIQYPANFASLASPISVGVILTNALSGNNVPISFDPVSGLFAAYGPLNNAAPANNALNLYKTSAAGLGSSIAATNVPHNVSNGGNFTGGAALGGAGRTNYIYTVDTDNGVTATAISFAPAQQAPVISVAPVGVTGFPPFTLSVTAIGSAPLAYHWLASSSGTNLSGTFTNIPSATTNTYVINYPITNYFEVIITNSVGSKTSAPVLLTLNTPITSPVVTPLWTIAPGAGAYPFLTSAADDTRGLGYDTNSARVLVPTTVGGDNIYILDGTTGTNIGTMNLTGAALTGTKHLDQLGVADDGTVYAGNLAVLSSGDIFHLNQWSGPSNSAAAYQSLNDGGLSATGDRWGDTMAVRGAGLNTQIILGSRTDKNGTGTNVALLTTYNGNDFQVAIIAITNVPLNFAANGITFGAGNTFWALKNGGPLYEISFDPVNLVGGAILTYPNPSQIPSSLTGIGIDTANAIFASVDLADTANDVKLYQLTGTFDPPVLFDQTFFASANVNGNGNGAIAMKYPRLFALDVDNGLVALTYGVPPATIPSITTAPASRTSYTNNPAIIFSVSAAGSLPLYYQWRLNGANIPGATLSTYTLTNPPLSKAGNYDVVVHNVAGSVTSTPPAVLTLLVPITSPQVTPIWSIAPGTNGAYLTTSGYETRGLAFDLTTSNLLVADHSNIHIYNGTNGQYISDVFADPTVSGLPPGGLNGWTIDQVGVADDGILYSCNLTPDGTAFSIAAYSPVSYSLTGPAYGGNSGGSDLNTLDPLGDRWGDTMAVRGSGPNTQILLGSYNGTNVALFTTPDGVTFYPTIIAVQGGVPLGFAGLGIAFGPTNTFYAKGGHSYNLRWVSFDTNANVGTVLQTYIAGTQTPNDLTGLGVDVTNNILGGVCYNDTPHDVQLFLLSGNSNAPYLFNQDFLPAANLNSQENSQVTLKGGWGFGLDANNGIVGFIYALPSAPAVVLTTVAYAPNLTTINWNNTFDNHLYQVQYRTNLLLGSWMNIGSPLTATNATASYTDTTAAGATRFYRVISQ